jgi:hypothetical protein
MADPIPPASEQITQQTAPPPPEEQEVDGYALVNNLLDQNKDVNEIIRTLEQGGVSHDEAVLFVQDVISKRSARMRGLPDGSELRQMLKQAGQRNMLIGGLVCVVGIVITLGTLASASGPAGGSYVIAWGAIVWGAIQFFRGMGQASQADQLPEKEIGKSPQGLDFPAAPSTLGTKEENAPDADMNREKALARESFQEKRVPFSPERKVFCNQCQQTFRTTVVDKCPLCRAVNSLVEVG